MVKERKVAEATETDWAAESVDAAAAAKATEAAEAARRGRESRDPAFQSPFDQPQAFAASVLTLLSHQRGQRIAFLAK